MPDRVTLTQISSRAWEHPADRAALATLHALPGLDEVVRKVATVLGERGVRILFLANAVRVGPTQRPELDAMLTEVLETLDWPTRPQLYVAQTPVANAFAIGFEDPFIVINSGTLEILDPDELRYILAHELGHIMSGHATYRTLAIVLMTLGTSALPFLAGVALLPFQLALLEWYRKSELSCDRAGLLGTQDPTVVMRALLKMAGGRAAGGEMDVDAFLAQAAEYENDSNAWDMILKAFATALRDHPFATIRAAELNRWIKSGTYEAVLAGTYVRRGTEDDKPLGDEVAGAADYYGDQMRQTVSSIEGIFSRAKGAFSDAMRGGQ